MIRVKIYTGNVLYIYQGAVCFIGPFPDRQVSCHHQRGGNIVVRTTRMRDVRVGCLFGNNTSLLVYISFDKLVINDVTQFGKIRQPGENQPTGEEQSVNWTHALRVP